VALKQARLLELGQDAIDGGQADVQIFGEQQPVDILGREMANLGPLEQARILRRGMVAFSPMLLRSSELLIGLPWFGYEGRVFGYDIPSPPALCGTVTQLSVRPTFGRSVTGSLRIQLARRLLIT
jgi:hypothetical protein